MSCGFSVEGKAKHDVFSGHRLPSPCHPPNILETSSNPDPRNFFEEIALQGSHFHSRNTGNHSPQQATLRLTVPPRPPEEVFQEILATARTQNPDPATNAIKPLAPSLSAISDADCFILQGEHTNDLFMLPVNALHDAEPTNSPEPTVTIAPPTPSGTYTILLPSRTGCHLFRPYTRSPILTLLIFFLSKKYIQNRPNYHH